MKTEIANLIDHTILNPDATKMDVERVINEALEYRFASVCVNPYWLPYCYEKLQKSEVKVCTVIGFPLGANRIETKTYEAKQAIKNGATEIDMVINIAALKDKNDELVTKDISSVVKASRNKAIVKVIIETALLTDEEKIRACVIAKEAQAHFVKTSTGFSTGGATEKDIKLMQKTVGSSMGIKASGGIRTLKDVQQLIAAGATRIGASSSVAIMKELL